MSKQIKETRKKWIIKVSIKQQLQKLVEKQFVVILEPELNFRKNQRHKILGKNRKTKAEHCAKQFNKFNLDQRL